MPMDEAQPRRPATRGSFEIAIICALPLEADSVDALLDHHWEDDGPPYGRAEGDPNAYSTGVIGRHNVVVAHMPGMGTLSAAITAANCRASFPNIRLAVVVGICGAVPFGPDGGEIVLGDVIISEGVVQYDLGRRLPERFVRKDTLLDSLGRPNIEIRSLLAKLKTRHGRKVLQNKMAGYMDLLQNDTELGAQYPGTTQDILFQPTYRHVSDGQLCEQCGCDGPLVARVRLEQALPKPLIHFGLMASGNTVMKAGEDRDAIAREEGILGFEMEGAGVWDSFPCVVIKSACDYADSHKAKPWQRYAAATAAACMKAFLDYWVPTPRSQAEPTLGPWFLIPYPQNDTFVGRESILKKLQKIPLKSESQARVSLFGLGGIGKTQIALEYAYWISKTCTDVSVFWVHGSNAERFRESYKSIALKCHIPGYNEPNTDTLQLVKTWLEEKHRGSWLMVIDNADDMQLFYPSPQESKAMDSIKEQDRVGQYIPECSHGSILITTRDKALGLKLAKGRPPTEVHKLDDNDSGQLLQACLAAEDIASNELSTLSSRLEYLPLALVQAAAFIEANTISVGEYIQLLDKSDKHLVDLLSEEFETVGRDSRTPRAVAETWILSFEQIHRQDTFASELLSLMSFFDRQQIAMEFLADYNRNRNQEESNDIRLTKAVGVLKGFSFLSAAKDQTLDMHRLVQLVTRKWLSQKEKLSHFAGQALLTVSHVYPSGEFENWLVCGAYLPHVYAVLHFEGDGSYEQTRARASLLHCTARYLHLQGQWKEAEIFQLQAVQLFKDVLGNENPTTLASIMSLGVMYTSQGRWAEAEMLQLQQIETSKSNLGADHPGTLINLCNLASTLVHQGRFAEAQTLLVEALAKLGPDCPDRLVDINTLALALSKQGRWAEAEWLQVKVMEIYKATLGADHLHTLISVDNLAMTLFRQGRFAEAEVLQMQVLETCKTKLGHDHLEAMSSMNNLAATLSKQGRSAEAKMLQLQVMDICKVKFGANHPKTIASMNNLGSSLYNDGQWAEAEALQVEVLEKSKAKFGPDHPSTLTSMGNLALILSRQGRWREAKVLEVEVMASSKVKLGADHPDTLASMNNLASTLYNQGQWAEAEALQVEALEKSKAKFGADHPSTLISMRNLASMRNRLGRLNEARS